MLANKIWLIDWFVFDNEKQQLQRKGQCLARNQQRQEVCTVLILVVIGRLALGRTATPLAKYHTQFTDGWNRWNAELLYALCRCFVRRNEAFLDGELQWLWLTDWLTDAASI